MVRLKRLVPFGAAAALAAAGCGESTSPSPSDPAAVAADVGGLSAAFRSGVAFQSLGALASSFTLHAPAARPAAPGLGAARGAGLDLLRTLAARAPAATLTLFPANLLGKTFVWDTAGGGRYRVDSTVTGAPATGVRFWLYYVASGASAPSRPLLAIGSLDLADQSTAFANTLGVKLTFGDPHVAGGQTLANYAINGVRTTSSYTLSAVGYVVDTAGRQLSFNLSNALNLADSTAGIRDTLVSASGTRVWMQITDSAMSGGHALQLADHYERGGHSVDVLGSSTEAGTDSTVNVSFKFDGATWATVTGSESNPTFTNASGQALTLQEQVAILQIVVGFFDIFTSANVVFAPAALVF